jgi:hypothetical protein
MNRRKFFAGIAAAITAAVIPIDFRDRLHGVPITWDRDPMADIWWRTKPTSVILRRDFAQLEARTIAYLERAWKECIRTGQSPDQVWITDEQLMEFGNEIHRSGRA